MEEYCYLGSLITTDAKCHKEIRRRIAMGKEAFAKRRELLKRNIDHNLKKRLIKTLIWPVVLYGSETWTMRTEDIKRLEAFEIWIWRRIEKISWMDKITNEEVWKKVEEERSLINTIRTRQTCSERGNLSAERGTGGEVDRKETKRMTENHDA